MEIKAAVARGPSEPFTIESVELDDPGPDEILVKIVGVGLCHTDLAAREQLIPTPLPAVFGHEGSGIVEKVGVNIDTVVPGDHVVLSYHSCGTCGPCKDGAPSYCELFPFLNFSGVRLDGSHTTHKGEEAISANFFGQSSFATFALAYQSNVVKVPKSVPLEILGPLGCGIQTGAGGVMRALACEAGSSLAIFGGGGVGLSAVLGAVLQGCSPIIVVDPLETRRQAALELGATHAINPGDNASVAEEIRAIVPSGLNYAFDTTALKPVVEGALAALGARGVLGLVGTPPADQPGFEVTMGTLVLFGQRVQGIIEGDVDPQEFIPEMVRQYEAGKFPFDKLISTFPFDAINEAIEAQHRGDVVKAVLLIE